MHPKKVLLYIVPLIFVTSAFLLPSINASYIGTALWIIILSILLIFKDDLQIKINKSVIVLLSFGFLGLLISSFALNPNQSFQKGLFLVQIIAIFIILNSLGQKEILKLASKYLVILTSLFTIFAYTKYTEIGQLPYNYLSGIFDFPEIYSAFVILPLIISLYFLYEYKDRIHYIWLVCSAILIVGLILSGSYIPAIQTLFFIALTFVASKNSFQNIQINRHEIIKKLFWLLVLAFITYCIVIYGARINTLSYDQDFNRGLVDKLYSIEIQNNWQSRGYYMLDSLLAFLGEPIKGYGLLSFGNAIGFVQNDIKYGENTAPYSLLLHLLVEGGIFYLILFIVFVYLVFSKLFLYSKKQNDIFLSLIATVLFSQMFHALYGPGFGKDISLFIWFIFLGLICSQINQNDFIIENRGTVRRIMFQIVVVMVILLTILSANISRAVYYREMAEIYIGKENSFAITYLTKSLVYNSFDDISWYKLWKAYYLSNKFEQAEFSIKKALANSENNSFYLWLLANTELAMDQKDEYRENLIKSLKSRQVGDMERYFDLIQFDREHNKYAEAISYGEKINKIYEDFANENKDNIRTLTKSDIEIIKQIKNLVKEIE